MCPRIYRLSPCIIAPYSEHDFCSCSLLRETLHFIVLPDLETTCGIKCLLLMLLQNTDWSYNSRLPPVTKNIKLLDVGSCYAPFNIYDQYDCLSIDLWPACSVSTSCYTLVLFSITSTTSLYITEAYSYSLKNCGVCCVFSSSPPYSIWMTDISSVRVISSLCAVAWCVL